MVAVVTHGQTLCVPVVVRNLESRTWTAIKRNEWNYTRGKWLESMIDQIEVLVCERYTGVFDIQLYNQESVISVTEDLRDKIDEKLGLFVGFPNSSSVQHRIRESVVSLLRENIEQVEFTRKRVLPWV